MLKISRDKLKSIAEWNVKHARIGLKKLIELPKSHRFHSAAVIHDAAYDTLKVLPEYLHESFIAKADRKFCQDCFRLASDSSFFMRPILYVQAELFCMIVNKYRRIKFKLRNKEEE